MRMWIGASSLMVLIFLIAVPAYSQSAKSPFAPVPTGQRKELASRLAAYTDAFRERNWDSLYDLAADANKALNDGKRIGRKRFARAMERGNDYYRLLRFIPIRTEAISGDQFDVYGCGEFPSGLKKPERIVVAVRAVREHNGWSFTAWDYPDPREPCSALSDPAWKPSRYLRLDYLPQLTCELNICTL